MKDLKHYFALIGFLSVGLAFFLIFNYNRQAQVGITLVMAAGYVLWGLIHHTLKREFHWRIVWEYLVVATVASLIIIFLLLRA